MANTSLFRSTSGNLLKKANARNEAGGVAYAMSDAQALAQYAATGCLNGTFYATAETQLDTLIKLASAADSRFVAKTALYCRSKGYMKDAPALLVAILSVTAPGLMAEVFDRVIDTPKMLRTFVQIVRSGAVGRKSLGTLPKRLIVQWLESRTDEQLFRGCTGNAPSLADIVRMVHPKPATASRSALYAYLIGKPYTAADLPELVRHYEAFKANPSMFSAEDVPDVPMDMLTSLPLDPSQWARLALRVSWQTLRMNLNTFARHGVFSDRQIAAKAAERLKDPGMIAKARVFPYQLLTAFANAGEDVPTSIKNALQDAMEAAIANVPAVEGKVWVFPDVSGSMLSPVTGYRSGSTTSVRCVDVAALVAAAILRKNPDAGVVAFSDYVVNCPLNARDTVFTNAQRLTALPSGGTDCSAPLAYLNWNDLRGDLVVYISDNQSWVGGRHGSATRTMAQWQIFKRHNPSAKLVCLDVQPYGTTQAPSRDDVLNIGGFSDSVFSVIAEFNQGTLHPDHWVRAIEKESL